ncbi:MAG: hypothetical protein SVM80_06415, partial [Halobacteriota archaeon]|nr:hypothetical protein [Halobacteriota archaeon]
DSTHIHDAYETLLFDIITGDQTLFVRADMVEEAWRLYSQLLDSKKPLTSILPERGGRSRQINYRK